MTSISRAIFSVVLLVLMTACGTAPLTQVVTKTVYVQPNVPDKFFDQKRPNRPIKKEEYLLLSEKEKETYLTAYIQELLQAVSSCHIDVFSIQNVLQESKKAAEHESQSRN